MNGLPFPSVSRPTALLLCLTLAACAGSGENQAEPRETRPPPAATGPAPPAPTADPAPAADPIPAADPARDAAETAEATAHEWSRRGRPEQAVVHFRRAVAQRQARREVRREAADRNFLGLELRRLGRPAAARRQFEKAEILAQAGGFLPGYAAAINNLGLLEEDAGHFAAARSRYRQAWLSRSASRAADGAAESALYRENLARLLVGAGELEEAEPLLAATPEALAEQAWIELLRRRPGPALDTLDRALAAVQDPLTRRILLDRRGTALAQLGRFAEAAAAYRQSASSGPAAGEPPAALAVNQCRLATLDPQGGPAAEAECARAVATAGKAGIPTTIFASSLFWRAHQLHRGGRTGAARRSAAKALDLIGSRPAGVADPARGWRFFTDRAPYLELAIRLAMELHRRDGSRGHDRAASADLERWRARAQGPGRDPAGPRPAPIPQELLDERTQVFDLVLAEPASYLWRIRRRELASYELPGAAVLEEAAQRYLALISDPRQAGYRGGVVAQGRRLAELLFGSRLERLAGGGDRLVFLGDGALALLPLAALPTPASAPDSPRYLVEDFEIAYLPSLSTLDELRRPRPVATRALALFGDPWYDLRRGDVRLAPLLEPAIRERLEDLPAFPLGRLPFAGRELDLVGSHLPRPFAAWRIDGPAARRARLVTGGLGEFAVVHLSAHGVAGPHQPPALALSQIGAGIVPEREWLLAGDLEGLAWKAELVVVSACRGLGFGTFRFAGAGGLARGFARAGSRRTLAALWDVEGAATAALMDHFYAALLERGLAPAAALRAAQRELLERARAGGSAWQAPFYWSGFLHFGDWRGFSLP